METEKTCTETGIKEAFEKRQYTRCAGFSTKRENLVEKQFANMKKGGVGGEEDRVNEKIKGQGA